MYDWRIQIKWSTKWQLDKKKLHVFLLTLPTLICCAYTEVFLPILEQVLLKFCKNSVFYKLVWLGIRQSQMQFYLATCSWASKRNIYNCQISNWCSHMKLFSIEQKHVLDAIFFSQSVRFNFERNLTWNYFRGSGCLYCLSNCINWHDTR